MKVLMTAALVVGLLTATIAVLYIQSVPREGTSPVPPRAQVFIELFKIFGAFTLLTAGGALAKYVADETLEEKRQARSEHEAREKERAELIKELAATYSEFYSLRKLYHSAIGSKSLYRASADLEALKREILETVVGLEGRHGGLKVRAITHFGLRGGEFGYKDKADLLDKIAKTQDEKEIARLQFDLLGECYDDWRHALEDGKKIEPGKSLYESYEKLLGFMESAPSKTHNPGPQADS